MDIEQLAHDILNQKRSSLSKAITLIESKKKEHQILAKDLLSTLETRQKKTSVRVGISGTPGVGKSTFIESFGNYILDKGNRLAVLAIDPSSYKSGGSILGDKTRMHSLSVRDEAYIRPSSNGSELGGISRQTRDVISLCESFGFDYIIIETVGVGQSEVSVSYLVDHFMLLMQPASGDELQGIKRGILELADTVVVNKADGDLLPKAKLTKIELESSLHILRKSKFPLFLCSAIEKTGLDEIYNHLSQSIDYSKRKEQAKYWIKENTKALLIDEFLQDEAINKKIETLVKNEKLSEWEKVQLVFKEYKNG